MTNEVAVANARERPQEKPLLSVAEAARRLGISESAAYRLAASDALPGLVRLQGARMRVRARVLDAWLSGGVRAAGGAADPGREGTRADPPGGGRW